MKQYLPIFCDLSNSIVLFCVFCIASLATAAPLASGSAFPVLKDMQDQHEKPYAMPDDVKHVAVAFTMSVGKSANKALEAKGARYLPKSKAVFIANIYGMPTVGRIFAMPKMRKYPHRIMLADAEGLLDDFPQKEDLVTVFDLDASGQIIKIHYWDPKSDKFPF